MDSLAEHLALHECSLIMEETSHEELRELNSDLPTDTHLVRYLDGDDFENETVAAIRAYRMSDIFDCLHDRGAQVLEIVQGYGSIRPNLFGIQEG